MKKIELPVSKILFIAATRGLLGLGAGLLAGAKLRRRRRRRIALTLITIGALTTIPAAYMIFGSRDPAEKDKTAAA
jgi:hypothetical protein